jgi:hypothetical protein
VTRRLSALAGAALVAASSADAHAMQPWSVGAEAGMCWSGDALSLHHPGFCGALHADTLFLRQRGRDIGVGPSLRLGTVSFDDVRLDAGISLLLPALSSFPIVLEAGPHLRNFHEPGVYGSVFFGLRSFNYYGSYEPAAGLVVTAERAFSEGTPSAIWITARIDGSWLMLPAIFSYNALK